MRTDKVMRMLVRLELFASFNKYSALYSYDWCCEYEDKMYEYYGAVYES